jgi:hypothetical protein
MSKLSSQAVRNTVLTLLLLGAMQSVVGQIPQLYPERTDQVETTSHVGVEGRR